MNKNLKAPHARETCSDCCWTRASMTEPYNATRSAQLASHRRGLDDLERVGVDGRLESSNGCLEV
jgi:hypothetical protein